MPELPMSLLRVKSLATPVLPLTMILKGAVASPVLTNSAVTPRAALLMAATTPSGVAEGTAMGLAGAPCTDKERLKATPPFMGVAAVAKPALMLRWDAARLVTETVWVPVAAVVLATTESAVGWLLPGVMLLKLLWFLRSAKAVLRLPTTNFRAA